MEKLKFNIAVKAAGGGKINIIALTSMEIQKNKIFIMPVKYQKKKRAFIISWKEQEHTAE